ncbi:hypothetical protein [Mandarin fish ranavirus]|nr:hypothetical protein [Mandarin fish ranavirus]
MSCLPTDSTPVKNLCTGSPSIPLNTVLLNKSKPSSMSPPTLSFAANSGLYSVSSIFCNLVRITKFYIINNQADAMKQTGFFPGTGS